MLALAVVVDVFWRVRVATRRPTQMVYDRYLGLQGDYYVGKVAVLQAGSVLLQAMGKVKVFQFLITAAAIERFQPVIVRDPASGRFLGKFLTHHGP